jgi:hypothetical protein
MTVTLLACSGVLLAFERGVIVIASRAFMRMLLLQAHHRDSKESHSRRVIAYAPNLVLARHPRGLFSAFAAF